MSNDEDLYFTFELEENDSIDCLFEINAAGTVWGSISGTLSDQEDLQTVLNAINGNITRIDDTLNTYGDIVTYNASDFASASQGELAESALQGVQISGADLTVTNNKVNIPKASTTDLGVVQIHREYGIAIMQTGELCTYKAQPNQITAKTNNYVPLVPSNIDQVVKVGITTNTISLSSAEQTAAQTWLGIDTSDFATAEQGQKADTALQPNDNISLLNNNSGFITNAVNDLTNYYLKSETYTKTEVQQLIASIPQFSIEVVQSLPVTGERMVLYLVPKQGEAPDVYDEYIWVEDENEFELLGSTAVDLTGYATETYVDNGLATKVSKSGDSMTGNLITSGAIYLTNVSNSVHTGASRIYFGSVNSPTNYISANSAGAFGIYNNARQGITCYPATNLFPDGVSGTMDLGRSGNKWKDFYISGTLYGASSNIAITDLISGATAGNTAVQPADLADYQPLLVSGTNIKTINNETVLGSGNIDIQSSMVAYGTSNTAADVAQKEVSIPEITELKTGQILYIKPSASATVADLTIKLNNFTAYPIRYNNAAITTSTDDLVWGQNFVSQFIFDGTYWQFAGRGYDNNTTYTQNILFDRGSFASGSGTYAITRYSLCLQKPDMTWEKVTNTEEDFSLATNKTVNTHGFLLNNEMLYYSNATVLANGAVSAANTMYRQNSGFDIRYSMNTTGTGYTAGDYIYLVGTIGVDGLFYLDTTQWWTNTLPTTNDGKIYVKIGKYVSGVTITLELEHPAYYHNGTRICEYQSASNKQDTLVSGTNIKTINNQSLLGSGNITIGGGGGGAVDSVNGQTGTVILTASDVGALADTVTIPTKTSDLTNDSGYITSSALSPYALISSLATVATSGDYDDLINKPTIPTVNNPTITFTQGGVTKGTITLNQSSNQTVALDAGGGGGGTWGSITGTLSDQTDLQNALNAKLNVSDVTEYTAAEVETLWGSI